MKALKVLILFFIFSCGINFILSAQECNIWINIKLEISPIKDKGGNTDKGEVPIKRSIPIQVAYAYIYNNIVYISFVESFSDISINIINEKNNNIVYSETSNKLNSAYINLGSENHGNYVIEIAADDISLIGRISL